jgi:hypothetical protein
MINLLGVNNLLVYYGRLLLMMDAILAAIFDGR